MIRMLLVFFSVFAFFFIGIKVLEALSVKATWNLTKIIGYSILCAWLTIASLVLIVILF